MKHYCEQNLEHNFGQQKIRFSKCMCYKNAWCHACNGSNIFPGNLQNIQLHSRKSTCSFGNISIYDIAHGTKLLIFQSSHIETNNFVSLNNLQYIQKPLHTLHMICSNCIYGVIFCATNTLRRKKSFVFKIW